MATIYVNGTDMEAAGYPLVALEGWAAAVELQYKSVALPGVRKQHVMPYPTVSPRVVRLSLLLSSTKAATVASRGAALDTLMAYFPLDDEITLRFADDVNKCVRGRVTQEASVSVAPNTSFAIPDTIVTWEITCHDPCKYDVSDTTVAVTNAWITAAVGTVDCGGIFTITGIATNPIISYASAGATSTVVTTMGFSSLALATLETLAIDLDLLTIYHTAASGTQTNYASYWDTGDWFRLDPADGQPLVKLSSGTGSLVYARKWRS